MSAADRMDADMAAARARMEAEAAKHPPVVAKPPMAPQRLVNDALSMIWVPGGPELATDERWVMAHGRRVLCRMIRPSDEAVLPVLVWLHGGGWVWASIDTHARLAAELAVAAGVAVVLVDYTLSPEAKFPTALMECAEVIRAIAADAGGWGIDPARMLVGGDSAGGNLALAVALLLRDSGGPALAGVHTFYPVTDSGCASASYAEFDEGYGLTKAGMQAYWELYTRDHADRLNPLASPLRAEVAGLPPVLIQVASLDVLRDDGVLMARRLKAGGVDTTLLEYTGVLHGFARLTGSVAKARTAVADAGAWIASLF
jgi:acetyl esterase